ncbi:MAG: hypothetical protein FWD40_07310 [Treponema sp.]|nr:hypothetical protein [Treponema sp.]
MYKSILFIILVLLIPCIAFSQNPQELRISSFIDSTLRADQEIWYSVRATEAGILTVETTGDIDTYLEAYDSRRNLITEDDDSGDNLNAKIFILVERNTTYLFKLRGYSPDVTGRYRILASHKPIPPMTTLRAGSSHNGNIVIGQDYWFSVRAAGNGVLTVETSGDTDTMLDVYNENFVLINSDDDSGEDLNARLEADVRSGKTYYFRLYAYGEESGPYRLTANFKSYPAPTQLNPGTFQNGNIAAGEHYWFSVRAPRRGRLIMETSGNIDTFLEAFTDSYEWIASDDDGGENYNARLEILAEANRTYLFRLRGYNREISGPYRIFSSIE